MKTILINSLLWLWSVISVIGVYAMAILAISIVFEWWDSSYYPSSSGNNDVVDGGNWRE